MTAANYDALLKEADDYVQRGYYTNPQAYAAAIRELRQHLVEEQRLTAELRKHCEGWRAELSACKKAAVDMRDVLEGCPHCDYDEAEGGLINHCDDCCRAITTLAWELFVEKSHDAALAGKEGP